LAEAVARYLGAQIRAGAQAAMIFDTWGGVLTPRAYRRFSLGPMARVVKRLAADPETAHAPVILFTKGGGGWLEDIAATGCAAVGLDWTVDLGEARRRVGDRVALQGNMDPAVLYASPGRIREEVAELLAQYGHGPGHVFNLGHGIHQAIDPEHVKVLVDAVHELSRPYHRTD
jgi:uroporphyrinogen decarboxylase